MSFLETLVAAFKGESARVPLARGPASPWFFAESGGGRAPFEYGSAVRRAYLENPVAQRAVRLVAEGIGGAPLRPADPRLVSLVTETSAGQSLLETLACHLLLHGNAYVQVLKDARGRPVELFALRPERVSIVAGEDGWPAAFAYDVAGRRLTIPLLDEDAAPNVIHIRHFHPADDHYGAGCLAAADEAIATHNAASQWNRQLLENAARPSGALVYEAGEGNTLTGDQFDRLKTELTQAYAGSGNAGRPRARRESRHPPQRPARIQRTPIASALLAPGRQRRSPRDRRPLTPPEQPTWHSGLQASATDRRATGSSASTRVSGPSTFRDR
ncbi:HK97 family phage portal protein [Novosphingobium sp. PhB57]|uniref:phage portal protein n=1 Tax=Novosphingobium sp. PhB57 TaxID=2485107 RepID=UPI0010DEC02E|nr:phage portal protein [Novosphingobium sp. PhB57]TCU59596.1 HK97 family phage portal protein [Novosphingobium sp. PhB57]